MKKHLSVSIGQYSRAGRKSLNQDFHGAFIPDEPTLSTKGITVSIADGISSSDVSQIASQTSVTSFIQDYYSTSPAWSVKKSAQCVLSAVNSWLYAQTQQSSRRFNKDKGYICTFSAIILKSNTAHIFHTGDTRIMRLNHQGLEILTNDHRRQVSSEQSYLTRALGIHNHLEADYTSEQFNKDDYFILATDGVYEHLNDRDITNALKAKHPELNDIAESLVNKAYEAGSLDNLTLLLIKIDQVADKSLSEIQEQIHLVPPPQKLQPRKEFDGYLILRELYMSSRSHVYLVRDIDTGEELVLKTPSTEMRNNEAHLESFLMEDWVVKRIDNTHIMKGVRSERQKHYLYTLTEFIEGKTLAQWMIDNPKPSIDNVRVIIEQVAKGLQALHRQEMIHQDLQPNNIMIDSSGTAKIIDFGSTKVAGISEIKERTNNAVFTAQYASPEYFRGSPGSTQSDIFSLGVLCYQMLSGKLPYGNGVANTHDKKTQQSLSYRPLSTPKNQIPDWIDFAIKQAVEIQAQKRYQEVSEFIHDLKHPNPRYLRLSSPPLIERNPVLFWQVISLILLCALIYQFATT